MARAYVQNYPWRPTQQPLEIAYNDSVNASTGYTPFFSYVLVPSDSTLSLCEPNVPASRNGRQIGAEFRKGSSEDVARARDAMVKAQARQIKYANQSRRDLVFSK
jgi:hypothetical protein